MRTIRRRIRSDREGAVLVLVALGMVVFLGFAALTVDLGMAYAAKAEAQRYADALSLAGASAYLDYSDPLDPLLGPEAISRVREYQALNAVRGRILADDDVLIEVLNAQQRVRVTVTRDELPTFFAGILGINEMTVGAVAAAEASAAASSRCVKPFAIPDRWEEGSTDPVQDYNGDQLMDFNIEIPCNGSGCSPNEIWTFEEGVDQYRPLNEMGTTPAWPDPAVATSWGSTWADGENRDNGARILITPQSAQGTGTPGWYQYWKMPGSSGASDLTDAIAGCIDLQTLGVGSVVEADPQTGSIGNPVYEAIKQLWDPEQGGDGDIEWDEANGIPHYPEEPHRSIWDSPRVFQVLLVHPGDISSGSSHTMRVADIATLFLENPTDIYGDQGNQNFKLPISGRLIKYGAGTPGPGAGTLQKLLRLVE